MNEKQIVHVVQRRKRRCRYRCGRKWGYPFSTAAGDDLLRLINRQGDDGRLGTYHCGNCKGFHNGHAPTAEKWGGAENC
jgi:hypothetical protein